MIVVSGKGPGEVGQLGDLGVVEPGLEAEIALAELGEAGAIRLVQIQMPLMNDPRVGHIGRRIPAGVVADAAEAGAHLHVRVEHFANGRAEQQIGMRNDPGASPHVPIHAAGALSRDSGDVFGFAYGSHGFVACGAIHRAALDEDGLADVEVGGVFQQFIEEITQQSAVFATVPEVVVRVDDLLIGVKGGFLVGGEPVEVVGDHCSIL